MAFSPLHINKWLRGSTLVGNCDQIPDDALRLARNVRLDRTLGQIEARPGWTRFTDGVFGAAILWLSKLHVSASTAYSYIQYIAGTPAIWRATDSWLGITTVSSGAVGTQTISDVNSPDGNGHFLKYFVNNAIALKDDGATTTTMGIAPPTAAPQGTSLATDLSLFFAGESIGSAVNWTGSNLSAGPADDPNLHQDGNAGLSFSIAASTFGSVTWQNGGGDDNLDTGLGGDSTVKNDDYIFMWVHVNSPQNLTYIQIDIDIDSATTGVADAFRRNYYSFKGSALTRLSGGTNEWTKLQARKSEFSRYGTDASATWANAHTYRIGFLTNAGGSADIVIDDTSLRGGVGLEGSYSYTTCYQNSTTKARGNPPKDADGVVLYTTPLISDRQGINLDLTNIITGGANNPGDAQSNKIMIFRKGGIFTTAVLVDIIDANSAATYLDNTADATLALNPISLELDNDVPPTGSTSRVIFGPDGSGHYFMIVDGYKLYISKPYETLENRIENWPSLGFALVGDGSSQCVAGFANSTQIRVWTTAISYNVVGVGQDTFLPVALDGTRGCVGKDAVAAGDSLVYFVSQDGIYEDLNGQQRKLTSSIDPFFQGVTVDTQAGWSTSTTDMADVRLAFLHEPTGSVLVMTYVESGSGTQRFLTLKPNLENGRLTEAFFDSSTETTIRSLFLDTPTRKLIAGGANGFIYRIEDPSTYSDNGTAIAIVAREKSYDIGQPQRQKFISHTEVEGTTSSQNLAFTAYYNRAITSEVLGTLNTSTIVSVQQFPTADPRAARRDIALEVSGGVTSRVMISRLARYCEPQPELLTFWDSGIVPFEFIQQLKRLHIDMLATVDCTIRVFLNDSTSAAFTGTRTGVAGRKSNPFPLTAGLQASTFRVTITSASTFTTYHISGFFKPLGVDQDYQEKTLVQGV